MHTPFMNKGATATINMVGPRLGILAGLYSRNRRQGEATELLQQMVAWADERDVVLILTAQGYGRGRIMDNHDLVRFYEKFGFRLDRSPDWPLLPFRMRREPSRELQGP